MDVAEYRRRYEAELAGAAPPESPAPEAELARTADEPAARADALAPGPLDEEGIAKQVAELLATLREPEQPLTARMTALQALGALDFLGPRFAPFRADYNQALRDVATDPEGELRESALELLAIHKDPYAQGLLVGGLERPEESLVPEAKAIQFLGYDDHTEIVPLVREIYDRATGPAREEALRVLATDPQSEGLFMRLLEDQAEERDIRSISASGLQSLNPEAFDETARKIVTDDSDYDDIRATSLAALAHGREAHEKPADPELVHTVRKLGERTSSEELRSSSQRFLQSAE